MKKIKDGYNVNWKFRKALAGLKGLYAINVKQSPDGFFPSLLSIQLTDRCNYQCIMCKAWEIGNKDREMTLNRWCEILSDFKRMGGLSVRFTGGEPFVRKDIFGLIAHANKQRLRVAIATNGHFLEEKLLPKLQLLTIDHITISLHGRKEVHDSIVGINGSFERVTKLIPVLISSGYQVSIACTILRENVKEVEFIVDYARQQKISVSFNIFDTNLYIFKNVSLDFAPSQEEMARAVNKLLSLKRLYPETISQTVKVLQTIPSLLQNPRLPDYFCTRVLMEIYIDSFGNVYHGCWAMPPVGSVNVRPLYQVFHSTKYHDQRAKGFQKNCPGCTCGYGLDVTMNFRKRK